MCIVFYTLSQPGYRLIFASNRDEYLDRPAQPAHWHSFDDTTITDDSEQPILSGIDLGGTSQGTWCGLTRDLRVGVITNIREPKATRPSIPSTSTPSRGKLLRDYLTENGSLTMEEFLALKCEQAMKFDGFNLLLFDLKGKGKTGYLSNRPEPVSWHVNGAVSQREPRGLSNTPIDQPWPKVSAGEEKMREILSAWTSDEDGIEGLMQLLRHSIPLTSLEDAKVCTRIPPVLIPPPSGFAPTAQSRWYATRVSTVILVSDSGLVTFVERDVSTLRDGMVNEGGEERRFQFQAS